MSEIPQETETVKQDDGGTANIIYILYLVGLVVGITGLIGVIMAYVNKGDAPHWLKTHYNFQIRTFWIGLLYSLVGFVLSIVIIGWFILLAVVVWWIVRCVKGMKMLSQKQPIDNVKTWLW